MGPHLTVYDPAAILDIQIAEVAEQADAHDSKSCGETRVGSTPTFGTVGFRTGSPSRRGCIAGSKRCLHDFSVARIDPGVLQRIRRVQ